MHWMWITIEIVHLIINLKEVCVSKKRYRGKIRFLVCGSIYAVGHDDDHPFSYTNENFIYQIISWNSTYIFTTLVTWRFKSSHNQVNIYLCRWFWRSSSNKINKTILLYDLCVLQFSYSFWVKGVSHMLSSVVIMGIIGATNFMKGRFSKIDYNYSKLFEVKSCGKAPSMF